MHQIFISGTNDQQRTPDGGCQTSSPLSQILTYYKRLGFKVGDRLILRASGQPQLYFFGQLGQDNIRLWETTFHEERDGLKVYRAIYEIENPVNRLRELGKTHDIHSYPNHLAPYQEGELLLGSLGNRDAKKFTSFFWEIDDLPLDVQTQKRQWLLEQTGIEVAASIFSGGKSEHNYIASSVPCTASDWERINRKLAIAMEGDTAIVTLARAMRVPGVPRVKNGMLQEVELLHESQFVISPQALETILNELQPFPYGLSQSRWRKLRSALCSGKNAGLSPSEYWAEAKKILLIPEEDLNPQPAPRAESSREFKYSGDTIPLEICLSRHDQDLIAHGVSAGSVGRNPMGYKLARNAIGTAAKLNGLGIRHSDNGYSLLEDFCRRCNPPLPEREIQRLWSQALKSPKAPLKEDQLLKRVSWWQWQQLPPNEQRKYTGEPDPLLYAQYVNELEEEERVARSAASSSASLSQYQERQRELEEHQESNFKNWVSRQFNRQFKRQAKRLANWSKNLIGQGKTPQPVPVAANPARGGTCISSLTDIRDPEVYRNEGASLLLYPPGEMAAVWQRARFQGYKAVFDGSLMGTGKSEIAGQQKIENWFVQPDQGKDSKQRLAYFSQSGANTTAPSLEGWTPLARMHNGLIHRFDKLTGGGNPFVERPKPGETPTIPGNCWATSFQHLLGSKNIGHGGSHADADGDSNPICNLCKERSNCKEGSAGKKPSGFKAEMKAALAHSRLKGTLAGFPGQEDFEVVAFIDEAGATIQDTKDIEASLADVDKEFFRLYQHSKELYEAFSFIQAVLNIYLSEDNQPKYGYDFATIKSWFADRNLDSFEFEWALRKLEELTCSQIQRELRSLKTNQTEDDVRELITLNWLIPFCRVMSGSQAGSARIVNNRLIVTVKNDRELELIQSFAFRVLMDATGSRDEIARKLGYEPWEILWVMEAPRRDVFSNVRVIQITGLGKCGKDRRELTQKRIDTLEAAIEDWLLGNAHNPTLEALIGKREEIFPNGVDEEKIAYLRHLRYWNAGELYYFGGANGERGSNAAADCQALILEGLPRENIGSALARYHTLYKSDVSADNADFQAWYHRQITDKVFQGVGRNRFTRRPDFTIPTFILGDGDLSDLTSRYGLTIEQIDAFQICPEAGTRTQVNGWKILKAIEKLRNEFPKVLQRQVSELTHLGQSTISEFAQLVGGWKPLLKISEVLFKRLYNKSDISKVPELTEKERVILEEYLPLFLSLDIPPQEVVHELRDLISVMGLESFLRILGAAPLHLQIRMLVIPMQGIPLASFNELMAWDGIP